MIGFYDYTVLLTYLSLLSASFGIIISLADSGHPYIGGFFLLFCGLCDAFDGKVARTKKDRTPEEISFGVQIDSLSDLVAFGVLPACIGSAMLRRGSSLIDYFEENFGHVYKWALTSILTALLVLYVLAALIRLAYFNVSEEKRQREEGGARTYFTGLPVTSAALVFPLILLLQYIIPSDVSSVYFVCTFLMGFAFLGKFRVRKPGLRGILILIGIGVVEFLLMLIGRLLQG